MQETHSVENDTRFWKQQWGDLVFFSHGTSHSAGVMILFNRFPGNVINHISDSNGHWLMVSVEFNNENYILVCIYGFNQKVQNKSMFKSLQMLLKRWRITYSTDKIMIGGDFNLVPDLWLD